MVVLRGRGRVLLGEEVHEIIVLRINDDTGSEILDGVPARGEILTDEVGLRGDVQVVAAADVQPVGDAVGVAILADVGHIIAIDVGESAARSHVEKVGNEVAVAVRLAFVGRVVAVLVDGGIEIAFIGIGHAVGIAVLLARIKDAVAVNVRASVNFDRIEDRVAVTVLAFVGDAVRVCVRAGEIGDVVVVTIATCGVAFAMFGRCLENPGGDVAARIVIAVLAFATLFHPNDTLVWGTAAVTLVALIWGISRHNRIAPPQDLPAAEAEAAPASAAELDQVIAEARRDIG